VIDRAEPKDAIAPNIEFDIAINADAGGTASERALLTPAIAVLPALALAACGGGSQSTGDVPTVTPPPPPPPVAITNASAGRFLAQATMGAIRADIDDVIAKGFSTWIDDQFAKPRETLFWDAMVAKGANVLNRQFETGTLDSRFWKSLITGQDQLRQRMGMALLEILVVGIPGLNLAWNQMAMAEYLDILWDNAFGNYRDILGKVSINTAMGSMLTLTYNRKANAATGSQPDENYARELLQLFTIGLVELNADGTEKRNGANPIETYKEADVSGLARVFTGWVFDGNDNNTADVTRRPLVQNPSLHELGTKVFLGTTIPANTDGVQSLKIALDAVFAHPNVPPFVSKQLIQRLVTSNPSAAYVGRVSAVFANNGSGVRGDMKAVIRAILLDREARNDSAAAASTNFGKLREPIMRLTGWARAFGVTSVSDDWAIGNTSSNATNLGQSPGRAPSVFNFFRPGYSPPNTAIATAGLVAPEMQITNESSVISYITNMRSRIISTGDVKADYTAITTKATDSQALLDEVNLLLAAGQVGAPTIAQFKTAVDSIGTANPTDLINRVYTAILLVMASPEYLAVK
jgi:uncharacterized protein (DUF1800 family)